MKTIWDFAETDPEPPVFKKCTKWLQGKREKEAISGSGKRESQNLLVQAVLYVLMRTISMFLMPVYPALNQPDCATTSIIFTSPKSKGKNVGGNNRQTHDQCLKWEYIDKICYIFEVWRKKTHLILFQVGFFFIIISFIVSYFILFFGFLFLNFFLLKPFYCISFPCFICFHSFSIVFVFLLFFLFMFVSCF